MGEDTSPGDEGSDWLSALTEEHLLWGSAKSTSLGDFPAGPVVQTLPSDVAHVGLTPGWGTKIPHAVGQLSLSATSREGRVPQPEKLVPRNEEPACCHEVKAQSSHNWKKKNNNKKPHP